MNTLKIAYVKSIKYQDLWVSDITNDPFTLLKTSIVRTPPLAFAQYFNTDFIIINDPSEESILFETTDFDPDSKEYKIPGLQCLHTDYHKHTTIRSISHNSSSINWSQYNIVICMNMCISNIIIKQYPHILWCYYISENYNNREDLMSFIYPTYDIFLNQQVHLQTTFPQNIIGFPYSFLHPNSLTELIINNLNVHSKLQKGIFIEINNTTERPVITIPSEFIYISMATNHPIILHNQNILENIKNMYNSKYFVKILGRVIRGNAALEAISTGTLLLVNKKLIMYSDLIPDLCNVETPEDVINIIERLDNDHKLYDKLLTEQKERMLKYYYNIPITLLYNSYLNKTHNNIINNENS